MYFHMLYESDMLVVLDIDQEHLTELDIWNHEKTKVLYSHKKQHPVSKKSIYSERGIRKPLNSLLDEGIKTKLNELNGLLFAGP
jgi:hypothetical protein